VTNDTLKEVTLGEIGTISRGKSKHRPRHDQILFTNGKYPMIQTGDVKQTYKYLYSYDKAYNEVGLKQSKLWPKGTLCITIAANIAESAILGIDACFPDSIVGFLPDKKKCNVEYIYYFIQNYKKDIQRLAYGTVQDNINLKTFDKVKIPLPSLLKQKQIVSILGSLDRKIEINNNMNKTLEEMAITLYKHWFIDFGPFQDGGFMESGLGMIPKGWEVLLISEVMELAYGKALKKDARIPGEVPVYGSSGVVGWHDDPLAQGPGVVIGRKGNAGTVMWVFNDFYPIDTTYYVIPKIEKSSLYYIYYSLVFKNLSLLGSDSAVPGLNRNIAYDQKVIFPPINHQQEFDKLLAKYFKQYELNKNEVKTLTDVRDYLLPRLLSGEIEINEAKEKLQEVLTNE